MISLFIFHQGTTEDRITLRADKRKEFSILCFSSFLAQLYAVFFSLFVILAILLQALICYCNFYMQYLVFKHPLP